MTTLLIALIVLKFILCSVFLKCFHWFIIQIKLTKLHMKICSTVALLEASTGFTLANMKLYWVSFYFFLQIIATIIRDNETIEWCKEKCRDYGRKAITALDCFEPSEAKSALVNIVQATTAFKPVKSWCNVFEKLFYFNSFFKTK